MRVVLHIDRLSLRGFPRAQREAIVAGLREALAAQFSDPAASANLSALPTLRERVDAGRVALAPAPAPGDTGARIGAGIARSVMR